MSGQRYDRILAGTALALVLAAPLSVARAQEVRMTGHGAAYAAVPVASPKPATVERTPAEDTTGAIKQSPAQSPAPVAPAAVTPVKQPAVPMPPEVTPSAPAQPAVAAQPTAATQPSVAAEPVVAPDPLASLDPADRAIAEKLRDLLAGKSDRIFATKKERAAVEAFYQNRNLAPIWFDKGIETARTRAVIARMKAADADGLDPSDYKTPNFSSLAGPDAQAEAELKLTQVVLTYARHAQAGRFPYQRISLNNIELPQQPPDAADVLTKVTDARDVAKTLDEFNPQNPYFQKLKAALAEMRGEDTGRPARGDRGRSGAQVCQQELDGRFARSDAAQWLARGRRPQERRQARRGGEEVPESAGCRRPGSLIQDDQGAQRASEGQQRHRPRQRSAGAGIRATSARLSTVNDPDFSLRVTKTRDALDHPGGHRGAHKATPLTTETMK